jgi:hypothetical protein
MKMKVIAMTITTGLALTLGILTSLHTQFAFADSLIGSAVTTDYNIQSNGDNSGYISEVSEFMSLFVRYIT